MTRSPVRWIVGTWAVGGFAVGVVHTLLRLEREPDQRPALVVVPDSGTSESAPSRVAS